MHENRLAYKSEWQVQELLHEKIFGAKAAASILQASQNSIWHETFAIASGAKQQQGLLVGGRQYVCTCAEIRERMRVSGQFLTQLPECLQLAQHETAWRQNVRLSAHAVHAEALHGMRVSRSNGLSESVATRSNQ